MSTEVHPSPFDPYTVYVFMNNKDRTVVRVQVRLHESLRVGPAGELLHTAEDHYRFGKTTIQNIWAPGTWTGVSRDSERIQGYNNLP